MLSLVCIVFVYKNFDPIDWERGKNFPMRVILLSFCTFILAFAAKAQTSLPLSTQLVNAAFKQTLQSVTYDSTYRVIAYPLGDVPANYGVCSDVVVRAYRQIGIDLQKLVHEDMQAHFSLYPNLWGLKKPDANIDHRRVPNLEKFFARHGKILPISANAADYKPGDIVSWRVPLPHIGIVSYMKTADGKRPLIIHNIGWGPKIEDILFTYPIQGHFRYGLE